MNRIWLGARATLYYLVLAITVSPFAVSMVLLFWIPTDALFWYATRWPRFAVHAGRWICGMRFEVKGQENLPDHSVILLPKHQSAWETFYFMGFPHRRLSFVYKREIHWLPFFGWGIATLKMISIDRAKGSDAFEQVVRQGTEQLRDGHCILIFPEGTRTPPGSTRKYKTGGARLAARTGATVVPIAHNAGELWPRNTFLKKPGLITVSIGPPIETAGKSADEIGLAVEGWIETEMRKLAPHRYRGPWTPERT